MKRGMSIEYLKCRADLIFEVDFGIIRKINSLRTTEHLIWIICNEICRDVMIILKIYKHPAA